MTRNILITGGSSGIGHALVEKFAAQDCRIYFTYFQNSNNAERLAASHANISAIRFKQGDLNSHIELLEQLPDKLDVLINNAAVGTKTIEFQVSGNEAQDEAFFRINSLGPYWLTEALLPRLMSTPSPKVIFMSSVGGGIRSFLGERPADAMSKAAISHYAKSLALKYSGGGLDVFTICPGATDTNMFRSSSLNHLTQQERSNLIRNLPNQNLIHPNHLADIVDFLCSNAGSVMRGSVIDASMGLAMHDFKFSHLLE